MFLRNPFLKVFSTLSFLVILVVVPLFQVHANPLGELKPEEVEKRAQLIVTGWYDEDMNQKNNGMKVPYDFRVEAYYKGSGPAIIRTAFVNFDVGWSIQGTEKGVRFLLFLEPHPKDKDVWVPVDGPSGMVFLENGKPKSFISENTAYYEKYLAKRRGVAPGATAPSMISIYVYGGVLLVLLAAVGVLVLRRRRA